MELDRRRPQPSPRNYAVSAETKDKTLPQVRPSEHAAAYKRESWPHMPESLGRTSRHPCCPLSRG